MNSVPTKPTDINLPAESNSNPELSPENEVVMVVDPTVVDYDSEYDTDNEQQSDLDNTDYGDLYEFRNVFICKYCDQAFSGKNKPTYSRTYC